VKQGVGAKKKKGGGWEEKNPRSGEPEERRRGSPARIWEKKNKKVKGGGTRGVQVERETPCRGET